MRTTAFRRRRFRAAAAATCALAAALALISGCVGRTPPPMRGHVPAGPPEVRQILDELAAAEAALSSFRASGRCILESPELTGARKCNVVIEFRRPADLRARGWHHATGAEVFLLVCAGEDFLLDLPMDRKRYRRVDDILLGDAPFSVSPPDIVRELFSPEDWPALPDEAVTLEDYRVDADGATAVLRMESRRWFTEDGDPLARRVTVFGRPWVLTGSELLDADGLVLAGAYWPAAHYRLLDGLRFPTRMEAVFPGERTRLEFRLDREPERNIEINPDLDDTRFLVDLTDRP